MFGLDKYAVETYHIFSDLLVVLILTDLAIFLFALLVTC